MDPSFNFSIYHAAVTPRYRKCLLFTILLIFVCWMSSIGVGVTASESASVLVGSNDDDIEIYYHHMGLEATGYRDASSEQEAFFSIGDQIPTTSTFQQQQQSQSPPQFLQYLPLIFTLTSLFCYLISHIPQITKNLLSHFRLRDDLTNHSARGVSLGFLLLWCLGDLCLLGASILVLEEEGGFYVSGTAATSSAASSVAGFSSLLHAWNRFGRDTSGILSQGNDSSTMDALFSQNDNDSSSFLSVLISHVSTYYILYCSILLLISDTVLFLQCLYYTWRRHRLQRAWQQQYLQRAKERQGQYFKSYESFARLLNKYEKGWNVDQSLVTVEGAAEDDPLSAGTPGSSRKRHNFSLLSGVGSPWASPSRMLRRFSSSSTLFGGASAGKNPQSPHSSNWRTSSLLSPSLLGSSGIRRSNSNSMIGGAPDLSLIAPHSPSPARASPRARVLFDDFVDDTLGSAQAIPPSSSSLGRTANSPTGQSQIDSSTHELFNPSFASREGTSPQHRHRTGRFALPKRHNSTNILLRAPNALMRKKKSRLSRKNKGQDSLQIQETSISSDDEMSNLRNTTKGDDSPSSQQVSSPNRHSPASLGPPVSPVATSPNRYGASSPFLPSPSPLRSSDRHHRKRSASAMSPSHEILIPSPRASSPHVTKDNDTGSVYSRFSDASFDGGSLRLDEYDTQTDDDEHNNLYSVQVSLDPSQSTVGPNRDFTSPSSFPGGRGRVPTTPVRKEAANYNDRSTSSHPQTSSPHTAQKRRNMHLSRAGHQQIQHSNEKKYLIQEESLSNTATVPVQSSTRRQKMKAAANDEDLAGSFASSYPTNGYHGHNSQYSDEDTAIEEEDEEPSFMIESSILMDEDTPKKISSHNKIAKEPEFGNDSLYSHNIVLFLFIVICLVHAMYADSSNGQYTSSRAPGSPNIWPLNNPRKSVGYALAILSALFFISSRLPQIYWNFKRKSTKGLSMLMFLFTMGGNIFFVLSLMPFSQTHPDWMAVFLTSIPFIIGGTVTLLFDMIIVMQMCWYSRKRRLDSAAWEGMGPSEYVIDIEGDEGNAGNRKDTPSESKREKLKKSDDDTDERTGILSGEKKSKKYP